MGEGVHRHQLQRPDQLPESVSGRMMNTMKKSIAAIVAAPIGIFAALVCIDRAVAADLERPPVQFIDKFGVNMANGQVSHSLSTVSIGGSMGLSHSVSVYANE